MTIIHIHGARAIFLPLHDNRVTESESKEIEIGVSGPIVTYKIPNALRDNDIHTRYDGRIFCVNYLYLCS